MVDTSGENGDYLWTVLVNYTHGGMVMKNLRKKIL